MVLPDKVAVIKIINEINIMVLGLLKEDHDELYDNFGLFKKDYFHNLAYKLRKWDGKVRLFSKNGITSIHFIEDIVKFIKQKKYKIKIIDNRVSKICKPTSVDQFYFKEYGVTLGAHQVEACNAAFEHNQIIRAGTGAGKTYITAALCKKYLDECSYNSIVIVPTLDLVKQTKLEISQFGLDVGEYSGEFKQSDKPVVVSTWQSLQNNEALISKFKVIIVDECHLARGDVLKGLIANHGNNSHIRIGLTGTIPKHQTDLMLVKYVLGNIVYEVPASDLIEQGWLAKPNINIYELQEDFKNLWQEYNEKLEEKITYGEYIKILFPEYSAEKKFLEKFDSRNEFIAAFIETTTMSKGNSLVLVTGVPFGKKLSKRIKDSIFIHGKDEQEVRQKIYESFATNDDITVIATFQLASTGLNIKRIFNLFFIDAPKSFERIVQSIGRGLRKAEDKNSVNIYDIHSNIPTQMRHAKIRRAYYKEEKYPFKHKKLDYKLIFE